MKADLNQVMAAVGAYGGIIPAETAYGFEVGLQTDALFATDVRRLSRRR